MYQSKLNLIQTEIAIKKIKDHFENRLAEVLKLRRVSAPLFLEKGSGLNDNLNGTEKPVSFEVDGKTMEIVHSLAKWKRNALYRYGFKSGTGLYTDMNAIRKDEKLDAIHSLYVDQWDWEKIIKKEDRNMRTLKSTVRKIYGVLRETEMYIKNEYNYLSHSLPENIFFITTQELEDKYPTLTPKQRERAITKEKKAVFLMQIGDTLKSGIKHDGRSSDYDDWKLNGDILVYNEVLDDSFELSSMGIRVDREA
jgi:aspartate--ammonia ligase